jgi:hypothetical protein
VSSEDESDDMDDPTITPRRPPRIIPPALLTAERFGARPRDLPFVRADGSEDHTGIDEVLVMFGLRLSDEERSLARAALQRYATQELSPAELAEERRRWRQHLAVLRTYDESRAREAGIAYAEGRIARIDRHAQRLLAAGAAVGGRPGLDFEQYRRVNLVELVQTVIGELGAPLGGRWVFHCPWHGGDDTPSLTIYPPGRGWYCFGCGRGGVDAASFMAEWHNCSQMEGLRWVQQLCDEPRVTGSPANPPGASAADRSSTSDTGAGGSINTPPRAGSSSGGSTSIRASETIAPWEMMDAGSDSAPR